MQNELQLVLCYGMISPLTSIAYFSITTTCPTSHFTQSYQNNTTESQPKRFAFERKGDVFRVSLEHWTIPDGNDMLMEPSTTIISLDNLLGQVS